MHPMASILPDASPSGSPGRGHGSARGPCHKHRRPEKYGAGTGPQAAIEKSIEDDRPY